MSQTISAERRDAPRLVASRAAPTRSDGRHVTLHLLGEPEVRWGTRRSAPWPYAKLPAILMVLGCNGRSPLRREWLAALLWPEGDTASLRRALFELRRHLREVDSPLPLFVTHRRDLALSAHVQTDLDLIDRAYRGTTAGADFDVELATQALQLWRGELGQGMSLAHAEDFDLWLAQMRARWQHRALAVADHLAEHHRRRGDAHAALAVARIAVERAADTDAAHATWWRCLVAADAWPLAAEDYRSYAEQLQRLSLAPSAALQALADELGLAPRRRSAPAPEREAPSDLTERLTAIVRHGDPQRQAEALLARAEAVLLPPRAGDPTAEQVLLMRRALNLRLLNAPWHAAMARLSAAAEAMLCGRLDTAGRLDLLQPLATWHGWMGRGIRGEVLIRSLGEPDRLAELPAAARVRVEMTIALCHSCSTGDPERSIDAARRGLRLAREGRVPACEPGLQMLIANAALNRDQPGDAELALDALERARTGGDTLQRFDAVNHHLLSAQWQLAHGDAARALAHAEEARRIAVALPYPLQELSATLTAIAARALLGDDSDLAAPLAFAVDLARRIGSQGYLMNALLLSAAVARRRGDIRAARVQVHEAQAIARMLGVTRIRKIPPGLRDEALQAA